DKRLSSTTRVHRQRNHVKMPRRKSLTTFPEPSDANLDFDHIPQPLRRGVRRAWDGVRGRGGADAGRARMVVAATGPTCRGAGDRRLPAREEPDRLLPSRSPEEGKACPVADGRSADADPSAD